jgi:DNA-binding response OmpR family regulator
MPAPDVAVRRVLVVDDDERVRTAVSWALEADGFAVEHAADGVTAIAQVEADPPALVVLDLSLPGLGGLDVLRRIRTGGIRGVAADGVPLPVIILSGRDGETDRIVGLDLGADDYLVKPFSPGELAARARSVLRRAVPVTAPAVYAPSVNGLPGSALPGPALAAPARPVPAGAEEPKDQEAVTVDPAGREVTVDGHPVELTAKEFDLLHFFVQHPRHVFSRAQLLSHVWTSNAGWQSEATVTEHVHRLRQKIEVATGSRRRLRTIRGVGYRWEP